MGEGGCKMTDEMKEASLRQGSDNTRKGLGISRVAFVMPLLQAYVWKEIYFSPHPPMYPLSIRALGTLPITILAINMLLDGKLYADQTWLTGKNAYCPNFHTEWSSSRLQDLAIQTLLPLGLPNCTANNFH